MLQAILMPKLSRNDTQSMFRLFEWLVLIGYLVFLVGAYISLNEATKRIGGFNLFVDGPLVVFGIILGAGQFYIFRAMSKGRSDVTRWLFLRALLVLAFGGLANHSVVYSVIGALLVVEGGIYWWFSSRPNPSSK